MPLDGYRIDDPFDNHPLFKTEEQARLEETMDGDEPAVSLDSIRAHVGPARSRSSTSRRIGEAAEDTGLWSKSRDFDWGD